MVVSAMNFMYLVYDLKNHFPVGVCRSLTDAQELALTYWEECFYDLYLEQLHFFDWYSHTWIDKTLTLSDVEKFKQENFKGIIKEKITIVYKILI